MAKKSDEGEAVGNILAIPSCFGDRKHTRANLTFEPEESKDIFSLQYIYTQEKGDTEKFDVLVDSKNGGIYARFMVIRSDSSNLPHILNDSQRIPCGKDEVEVDKRKTKKNERGWYNVVLKKKSKTDVKLKPLFDVTPVKT